MFIRFNKTFIDTINDFKNFLFNMGTYAFE